MKKSILLAGLFLMAASCSSDESVNTVDGAESFAPVTVSVEGFSIAQGDIPVTRAATALADYSAIKFPFSDHCINKDSHYTIFENPRKNE